MQFFFENSMGYRIANAARGRLKVVSLLGIFALLSSPALAQKYTITDLGVLSSVRPGDTGAQAFGINSSGSVVGYSGEYSGGALGGFSNADAFQWTPTSPNATTGTISFLGGIPLSKSSCSYGGSFTIGQTSSFDSTAVSINDSNLAVGASQAAINPGCLALTHVLTFQNGMLQDLDGPSGYYQVGTLSVNNYGHIVGWFSSLGPRGAWLYDGAFHDLGLLPGYSLSATATKININDRIAGFADNGAGVSLAFVHTGAGPLLATDAIGTLGGASSAAYGMNDSGYVVGSSSNADNTAYHAFVYDQYMNMRDLGTASSSFFNPTASSSASAINNIANDVVGWSDVDNPVASDATHAVIWKSMREVIDLNTLIDSDLAPRPNCSTCWELLYANDINDLGQIVGAGLINNQLHAFLLTPDCASAGGDSDGDGLCDDWERNGVTLDGQFVNLPAMGADPYHKDIFVQADYMETSVPSCDANGCVLGHSHKPKRSAMSAVIAAFADAPVTNPDGKTGITLHVDCGPSCIMNPLTGQVWGSLSQANRVPHVDPVTHDTTVLGKVVVTAGCQNAIDTCEYDWTDFDQIKNANFSSSRARIFHYVLFAHDFADYNTDGTLSHRGGIARGIPESDYIVSLGGFSNQIGTTQDQASTFMHELGHNLGLQHGGFESTNFKPNYLSVMNYLFAYDDIPLSNGNIKLDYSRFQAIPDLDLSGLDETVGLNGGEVITEYGTAFYCPGGNPDGEIGRNDVGNANGPIDWNCDKSYESKVPATIVVTDASPNETVLKSFNDWAHLVYAGGTIGALGSLPPHPSSTPVSEHHVPVDPLAPYVVQMNSPGVAQVLPGTSLNLTFNLTNAGRQQDTYNLSSSFVMDWWNTASIPATITLASGASQQITVPVTVSGCAPAGTPGNFTLTAVSAAHPSITDSGVVELTVSPTSGSIAIPNVVGLTQAAAQMTIASAGLSVGSIVTQGSASVPSGEVLSQTPVACGRVSAGTPVSLTISSGTALVAVPNVVGDTQSQASTSISAVGLALSTITTSTSLIVPAGNVISESPAAGTAVLAGSSVVLLVSSGPSLTNMVPNVVGDSLATATQAIGGAGFAVGTLTGSVSSTVPGGTVLSESPTAGTTAIPGSSVDLTVSVGTSLYTVMPNIVGDTQAQAVSAIQAAGLFLSTTASVSSTTVPAGLVTSQNPLAGQFLYAGSPVYFAISAGLQPNTVPNVYGLPQAAAASALSAVGLKVGTVTPYPFPALPAGDVLGQNPIPGTYATAGSTVSLTVSSGSPQYTVPDLSITSYVGAASAITTAGLALGTFTPVLSSTVSQGFVISQSPAAGTAVASGSPVNVVYSAGSVLYPVPSVVGESQDLATQDVLHASFYVAISRQSSTAVPDGVVISQSPAGGGQALAGAVISLVVSSGGPVVSTIPNLAGMEQPFAENVVFAAGFAIGSVSTQPSVTLPARYIVSQSPASGASAPWDTPVSLVVSSGPPSQVTIPNIVGETQPAAIAALNAASLGWALTSQSSQNVAAGNVISQNPPGGTTSLGTGVPVSFVVSAGAAIVPSYSYLGQFGESGGASSQDGQFQTGFGLAIDPVSRNIIVGGGDGRVQVFDANGNFKSYFGGNGIDRVFTQANPIQIFYFGGAAENGLFSGGYTALAIDPVSHNIIAVDVQGDRVLISNSAGVFQSQFGSPGQGPGQFDFTNNAQGVAIDPVTENIVVSDNGNYRVQVFNSAGVYLSQFGTFGGGDGQFSNGPAGIAIDPTSRNIVVADWGNSRVQIFNSAGGYLSQFGGPGAGNGTFYEPTIVAIDPASHNIAIGAQGIAAALQPFLQIFTSTGLYLTQFGGLGSGNGQFSNGPTGIAFDPVSHNIVLVDGANGRVEIFGAVSVPVATTTTLVASSNPATFGQSVTFTATVSGTRPTGTVQFLDGGSSLSTPTSLTGGIATLTISTLTAGTHQLTAIYSGDSANAASTSAALSELISSSGPQVHLTPSSLTFASTATQTSSPGQTVTLLNKGNAALTIQSVVPSGDFAEVNTCPGSLPVGGSCIISVTFGPSAIGSRVGAITITDNASDSPQMVSLGGTGAESSAPLVALSPSGLFFGNQSDGTTSSMRSVTLTNTGNAPLLIGSIAASGDFAETNTCPTSVMPNGTCTVFVTFTPTIPGVRAGGVTFTDNAFDSPQTTRLLGSGAANGPPALSLAPSTLSFGNQNDGSASAPQTLTLTNLTNAAVAITSLAVSTTTGQTIPTDVGLPIFLNPASNEYSQTNTCPASLAAGGRCTITVTFAPVNLGVRIGQITILNSAPNGPLSATLAGVSVLAEPLLSDAIVNHGTQAPQVMFVDVKTTNIGQGLAHNVQIGRLTFHTLAGTGTVTYNTALSPGLPVNCGDLVVGGSFTVRVYLNVPSTVKRFTFVENGSLQDAVGTSYLYSNGQMIFP